MGRLRNHLGITTILLVAGVLTIFPLTAAMEITDARNG